VAGGFRVVDRGFTHILPSLGIPWASPTVSEIQPLRGWWLFILLSHGLRPWLIKSSAFGAFVVEDHLIFWF